MKNEKKHLPMIGVGPIIVTPQLIVTAVAIILSEIGKFPSIRIDWMRIPFAIIGILLILFGIWLWYCSNFKTKIDKYIEGNHLATTGVYGIVRNPIYSAFFLACVGALLIEGNIILFFLPVIYYIYMTVFLKKTEEAWLNELHGQEYEDYCKKVHRCIPWFQKNR